MLSEDTWAYLRLMPRLHLFLVLKGYPLIIGPHLLHDLCQVLTFRCVNVHLHGLRDLGTQLRHILGKGKRSALSHFLNTANSGYRCQRGYSSKRLQNEVI